MDFWIQSRYLLPWFSRLGGPSLLTISRLELSFLGKLPSSQRSLIPEGQPIVLEIAVTESEAAKRAEQPRSS
jgi:hypothetical protein